MNLLYRFIIVSLICMTGTLLPAKATTHLRVDEPLKAPVLLMDDTHYFIYDHVLLHMKVYSRKSGKKIAQFGRLGEGPGDLRPGSTPVLAGDSIWFSGFPKLAEFSKTGEHINDTRNPAGIHRLIPFGNHMVGIKNVGLSAKSQTDRMDFVFFSPDLKEHKDLFKAEFRKYVRFTGPKAAANWVRDCTKARVYRDRLFIGASGTGYFIRVFNRRGEKAYDIRIPYRKQRVTDSYKFMRLERAKKIMGKVRFKELRKRFRIEFPEYFPAFVNFFVANGKVYVFKYPVDTQIVEVLDLKGSRLAAGTITLTGARECIEGDAFHIEGNRLFHMVENDEDECWEIQSILLEDGMEEDGGVNESPAGRPSRF